MVGGPGFEPGASRSRTVPRATTLPTNPDVNLVEIREMITSGTREDHKTLTSVLVGPTRVEGRHSIQPSFIVPTQKVRVLSRVVRPAGIEPAALRSGAARSVR
jgi:hypothetical protein